MISKLYLTYPIKVILTDKLILSKLAATYLLCLCVHLKLQIALWKWKRSAHLLPIFTLAQFHRLFFVAISHLQINSVVSNLYITGMEQLFATPYRYYSLLLLKIYQQNLQEYMCSFCKYLDVRLLLYDVATVTYFLHSYFKY